MVIVIHFSLSVKQYAQAESCPGRALKLPERCPHPDCQAADSLIRWGTYHRWACTETEAYRLCIQRVRCRLCGRTHSLLPDFLHPYRHYVLALLHRVIWLYLIVGLGFGRLMNQLPETGPAPETVREWVRAFAYGAGHLLLAALTRFLLQMAPQTELPGPAPSHLARSRQVQHSQRLTQAHAFWQLAEQLYAQVKERQPRLAFSVGHLFPFLLHKLVVLRIGSKLSSYRLDFSGHPPCQPLPSSPFKGLNQLDHRIAARSGRRLPPNQQSFTLPLPPIGGYTGPNSNMQEVNPMSHPSQAEERRTEIALFRYTLILPIVREPSPRAKQQMRRNLAAVLYDIPHTNRRQVSVTTLRRWEDRYRAGGFEALKPQPRSDRGQPRAVSAETLDRAEALKREQPFRSARSIARILSLDHTNPVPEAKLAPRTLRRHLAQRGATTPHLLTEQQPKAFRRFERSAFGDLWQGDAMHGPTLPDPAHPDQQRQVFLFAFLDDHSRLVPHAQFYWNEQLPRMEDCFKRAILRYGVPLAVYVDRGKVYTSKQFDTICATLGIQRILASPYAPEGKGKVERFFRFVRSDFLPELKRSTVTSLAQLNESLLAWLEVVYHRQLHTETGQAPLERYRQDPAPATRPVEPATLRQAFLHRDQRKVTKTATFSFQGNRYRAPAYLCGRSVELRYDPFDLSHLELWLNNTFLQMAQPDQLVNPIHPEVTPDPVPTPPAETGLDYLALLRTEHHRFVQAQLEGINFSQLADNSQSENPNPETTADDHPQEADDDPAQ